VRASRLSRLKQKMTSLSMRTCAARVTTTDGEKRMQDNRLQEQIRSLRLGHMLNALEQQWSQPGTYGELGFEERLSLLLEHELLQREATKVSRLRRQAKLRLSATASGLDWRPERGLKRQQMGELMTGGRYHRQQNILITGPTGCGKTYVACALGEQACQQHVAVGYWTS